MSVELTGIAVNFTASSNGSQSVTIPTDCDCVVVAISGYNDGRDLAGYLTWDGGTANDFIFIERNYYENNSDPQIEAFYMLSSDTNNWPGTGSKTLSYSITAGSYEEGFNFSVSFWKNVDTTGTIVDSERGPNAADSGASHTSSLTSISAGDMCVAVCYDYGTTAPDMAPTGYGQTVILESANFNSCSLGVGYELGEDAYRIESMSDGAPIYFALKGSGGSILPINVTGTLSATGAVTRQRSYSRSIGGSI